MPAPKKIDPFKHDDEEDVRTEPAEDVSPEPKDPEVSVDDDDDDDEIDRTPKPGRDEKRRNRYRENQERADRAERDAADARQRESFALQQAQHALQLAQQRMQQPAQQQQQDPIDVAEGQLLRERQVLYAQYEQRMAAAAKTPLTQPEKDEYERRAIELEDRKTDLRFDRRMRERNIGATNPAAEALKVQLTMQYPEVVANQNALTYANGLQMQAAAEGKQPWSMDTIRECMDGSMRKFRLGKYASQRGGEPDPVLRDRYQAPARGASTQGGKGEVRKVVMTKEYRKMADSAYKHIKDPTARYKMFAKGLAEED